MWLTQVTHRSLTQVTHRSLTQVTHRRYNIWSDTMQDYLFASDISNLTATAEVPDGLLRLDLYQTESVAARIEDSLLNTIYNVFPACRPS